jgi:hypothetical protein
MNRALRLGVLVAALAGCQLPPEQVALKPLPEDGLPQAYVDLVTRARTQASAANDAFYVNKWNDLEDAAKALEQTSRFLPKATAIPVRHKDTLAVEAGDLGKESAKLRDAAKSQDDRKANDAIQHVNLLVRQLRAEN